MIDQLKAIAIFVTVVKQGSFRGAAKAIGLSPSVISYHITQLEQRVGTALLYRSTRQLSLTHKGTTLYEYAQQTLAMAEEGLNKITADDSIPSGKLTITLSTALTRAPLNQTLAKFAMTYPNIHLQLSFTDVRENIIASGIDLAIRAGNMPNSDLKSKALGSIQRKLVCSADYYAKYKLPKKPDDLLEWQWIKLSMLPNKRILINKHKTEKEITFNHHISVNNVEAMTQFCMHGAGLATPPDYLINTALAEGTLKEVLPQWTVKPIPIYAVWPNNISDNPNVRRLLTYISANYRGARSP